MTDVSKRNSRAVSITSAISLVCLACLALGAAALATPALPPLLQAGEPVAEIQPLPDSIRPQRQVHALAFGADNRTLVTAASGLVQVWDTASGRERQRFDLDDAGDMLSLSQDGRFLALGSLRSLWFWEVAAATPPQPIPIAISDSEDIAVLRLSPDGRTLAVAILSRRESGTIIQMWDPLARRQRSTFKVPGSVQFLGLSPDGRTLATGSLDETLRLWDTTTGQEERQRLKGGSLVAGNLPFSPDGRPLGTGHYAPGIHALSASPDGQMLAGLRLDDERPAVTVWDSASGRTLLELPVQPAGSRFRRYRGEGEILRFSPDGRQLAAWVGDGTVRLWDVALGRERLRLEGQRSPVSAVHFSADGRLVAASSQDGVVRLWDAASGQERQRWAQHLAETRPIGYQDAKRPLRFQPQGQLLAVGGADGSVSLWDIATDQPVGRLTGEDKATPQALAFSPDGRLLAVGAPRAAAVQLWDVAARRLYRTLEGSGQGAKTLAFSPDGQLLAAGSENDHLEVWEVAMGQPLPALTEIGRGVSTLAFHPDGRQLASGGEYEQTIRLWDLATSRVVKRFTSASGVLEMRFSPDGETLFVVARDGSLYGWHVASGQERLHLAAHVGTVTVATLSPDAQQLVTGAGDGAIRLYRGTLYEFHWLAVGGQDGNWLTCHASRRCWRADNGAFVQRQEAPHVWTPLPPGEEAAAGHLKLVSVPATLSVLDGSRTEFLLTVRNESPRQVYWTHVVPDTSREPASPLLLHCPPPSLIIEPEATIDILCQVSASLGRLAPQGQRVMLQARLTTAHGAPLPVEIPVTVETPEIRLLQAQQSPDYRTWQVTLHNAGSADLPATTWQVLDTEGRLAAVTHPGLRSGDTVTLEFALPARLWPHTTQVTLQGTKPAHPLRTWQFPSRALTLPGFSWHLYALAASLPVLLGGAGLHGWRRRKAVPRE